MSLSEFLQIDLRTKRRRPRVAVPQAEDVRPVPPAQARSPGRPGRVPGCQPDQAGRLVHGLYSRRRDVVLRLPGLRPPQAASRRRVQAPARPARRARASARGRRRRTAPFRSRHPYPSSACPAFSHEGACQAPRFRRPKGSFPCACRLYLSILLPRRGGQRSRSEPQALPLTAAGAGGIGSQGRQAPVPVHLRIL